LGVKTARRSTISDANATRDWKIYRDLFQDLVKRCQLISPKHAFRFKNRLRALDATTIKLCLKLFPWAKYRQRKGAIKLHTSYEYGGQIPSFLNITDGKTHEIRVAREFEFEADSIAVFDRGYIDFPWFYSIHQKLAYWLTRAKRNMSYVIVRNPVHCLPLVSPTARRRGIRKDQVIRITGRRAKDLPIELRLITYYDAEKKERFRYLTNIFHLSAWTVVQIYKARWEIELFFKWIKQHLKIKTFLGTSENAVYTQIWIAMITYVLLAYIKHTMKSKLSLLQIHRLIRENLFERKRLVELLQMSKYQSNEKKQTIKSICQQLNLDF
jgi:putative transposase